jgi:hypothetical protein
MVAPTVGRQAREVRRSVAVKLTLLPMLASAAVASAQPARAPIDTALAPPGLTEPVLSPPGLTPPLDCAADPDGDVRRECTVTAGVIRGGFGHYFWVGGG